MLLLLAKTLVSVSTTKTSTVSTEFMTFILCNSHYIDVNMIL